MGAIGRRDAAGKCTLSPNLIQLWLTQYDRRELSTEEAEASVIAEYEAKIAALHRKVGQLTNEPLRRRRTEPRSYAMLRLLIIPCATPSWLTRQSASHVEMAQFGVGAYTQISRGRLAIQVAQAALGRH